MLLVLANVFVCHSTISTAYIYLPNSFRPLRFFEKTFRSDDNRTDGAVSDRQIYPEAHTRTPDDKINCCTPAVIPTSETETMCLEIKTPFYYHSRCIIIVIIIGRHYDDRRSILFKYLSLMGHTTRGRASLRIDCRPCRAPLIRHRKAFRYA